MEIPTLEAVEQFVRDIMAGDSTGHDWSHVERVLNMACRLAAEHEGDLDMIVVRVAALLHDIPDAKLTDDVEGRYAQITAFLSGLDYVSADQAIHILDILGSISWSSGREMVTDEGRIVQDADRLDALGAVGIAHCFAYGGKAGRPIYDPRDLMEVTIPLNGEHCRKAGRSSIAHFYDKLFLLKDHMNTPQARELASRRTEFLRGYLNQFFKEWGLCD